MPLRSETYWNIVGLCPRGDRPRRDFDVATDPPHFDRSEHRAWLSGVRAADFFANEINKLSHITFLVHSQGNVLMGEMLRRLSPEVKNKITYVALQGAISAQLYTRNFMAHDSSDSFNMHAFDVSGALDSLGRWCNVRKWRWTSEKESPDIYGHYPYGRNSDPPYLDNVLTGLWHSVNYYNRNDYALNIWLGNNGTKPDNLKGAGGNDRSFGFTVGALYGVTDDAHTPYKKFTPADMGTGWKANGQYGRYYQNRDIGHQALWMFPEADKVAIYPGNVESSTVDGDEFNLFDSENAIGGDSGAAAAKWCVFSYVTRSRSLAVGQLSMRPYFTASEDLAGQFRLGKDHYYHSWEFRSNSSDTWELWHSILGHVRVPKDQKHEEK